MDLTTLEIDPGEARAKLDEYAGMIAAERTAEDAAIEAGYRAAARGQQVILLSQTIAAGGFFPDSGLPRIAVIRAGATTCYCRWESGAQPSVVFAVTDDWRANRGALVGVSSVRVPVADPPAERSNRYWRLAAAPVPIIPPKLRPRPRLAAPLPHPVGGRGVGAGRAARPGADPPHTRGPVGGAGDLGPDCPGARGAQPARRLRVAQSGVMGGRLAAWLRHGPAWQLCAVTAVLLAAIGSASVIGRAMLAQTALGVRGGPTSAQPVTPAASPASPPPGGQSPAAPGGGQSPFLPAPAPPAPSLIPAQATTAPRPSPPATSQTATTPPASSPPATGTPPPSSPPPTPSPSSPPPTTAPVTTAPESLSRRADRPGAAAWRRTPRRYRTGDAAHQPGRPAVRG